MTEGERTKTNPDKTPGQKPPRTLEIEFVQGIGVDLGGQPGHAPPNN